MEFIQKYRVSIVFLLGLLIGIGAGAYYKLQNDRVDLTKSDEVHYHADLVVYVDEEKLDFTKEEFQSRTGHILHGDVHLHDGQGDVVHFHAEGVTLGTFFSSLGFTLTNDCLTTPEDQQFCTDEAKELKLFVNGEEVDDIAGYIPADLDRMMLYLGEVDESAISELNEGISDRACIYSGSCPERGVPPPEECGLTCEI